MQVQTRGRAVSSLPDFKEADHKRRVGELARCIDELSGEMGVAAFRDAIRKHGYDVDADLGMLLRRGVDRQQH
ncbi:hypothetical protein [Bradyrhizobium yuanmingense]|uniref:hypothetical protein n=1 Tax=Bradyrhizobium yuanmingense TaxID=108015 RepID=UPI0023B8F1C8|nr:hypothetical protein [Bradyrhizobium yuanmingense]MDF0584732.1 hypothetical protein [Bradyrhizobium yuanmingense]